MSRDALLYIAVMVAAGDAVSRYVDGVSFGAFEANDEKRAAVERQLFILGEAAARLPDEWKLRLAEVPWRKIVGLRNMLAHGYWVIDAEELWDPEGARVRGRAQAMARPERLNRA